MFFKRAKKSEDASPAAALASVSVSPAATDKAKPAAKVALDADKMRRVTNAAKLGFKTTADVARSAAEPFEARRVWDAVDSAFAATAGQTNTHVIITAPPGCGALRAVAAHLATVPKAIDAAASDWLFVPGENSGTQWSAIPVPAGQGKRLAAGITAVVAQLRNTLPYLLKGEDLSLRRASIETGFAAVRDDAFTRLREMAHAQNVAVLTTPMGFAVAPMHEGKVVKPEVLARLPQAMRDEVRRKVESIEGELQTLLADVPSEAGGQVGELAELTADYVRPAVAAGFEGLVKEFSGATQVMGYLTFAQDDIVRRACREGAALSLPDYSGRVIEGAGKTLVVVEPPANAANLSEALLRAGKGAVLISASHLDGVPGAWPALRAAMQSRSVELAGLPGHVLPIASRVVVIAEPGVEASIEECNAALFGIHAAFAADAARSEDSEVALSKMIAVAADERGLLPLEAAAVAHLIGEAARMAGRPGRLSGDVSGPLAIATDASRKAAAAGRGTISEADIQAALAERRPAKIQPLFAPAAASIVGRVLALGVSSSGPVEVWATVRPGKGTAADIARAAPGSDAASSASAVLWSLIAGRYVPALHLSLAAAIVHEPPLSADSATRTSAAEAYALFSALAEAPIATSFAAAGWVSPSGALLPVTGISAAIECAFDHHGGRDAAGPLSIVIPRANEADLMLRSDVVEAARKGKLQIFTAADIDEGLTILTGIKAGTRTDASGEPSLNRQIEDRLVSFARQPVVADATRAAAKAATS